jgi:hypothetical protein
VSLVRHQRRKQEVDSLQGELRKFESPSFNGEREREDDDEAWLLGIQRYFQFHNYSSNLNLGFPPTIYMGKMQCGGTS